MSQRKVQSVKDHTPVPRQPRTLTLKLDPEVLDEIDALLEKLERLPEYRAFSMSRQVVLRLAIEAGLPVLRAKTEETD